MSDKEKIAVIKMLESLAHQGLKGQLRNAINAFRQNRKFVDIQRNFLKRLLVSKAGMVAIGFRRLSLLP